MRMARKWLEGAAELRQETVTQPFTKIPGKRADELISGSVTSLLLFRRDVRHPCGTTAG